MVYNYCPNCGCYTYGTITTGGFHCSACGIICAFENVWFSTGGKAMSLTANRPRGGLWGMTIIKGGFVGSNPTGGTSKKNFF